MKANDDTSCGSKKKNRVGDVFHMNDEWKSEWENIAVGAGN